MLVAPQWNYSLFSGLISRVSCFTDNVSAAASTVWSGGQRHPQEGEGSAQHGKILCDKYCLCELNCSPHSNPSCC